MVAEVANAYSWITAAYVVGTVGLGGSLLYLLWERRHLTNLIHLADNQAEGGSK